MRESLDWNIFFCIDVLFFDASRTGKFFKIAEIAISTGDCAETPIPIEMRAKNNISRFMVYL
jgi:hypothetical protein